MVRVMPLDQGDGATAPIRRLGLLEGKAGARR